jgi:hypothetical protein
VAHARSVSAPATSVPGPPTGLPTTSFMALGFGVGKTSTGIARRA